MAGIDVNDIKEEDLDFACTCTDKSKAEVEAVMEWAHQFMNWPDKPVTDEDRKLFLGRAVVTLSENYRAEIVQIIVDQWFGVIIGTWDNNINYSIQCDYPEAGIAYGLRKLYLRFGEKRERE